MRRQTMAFIACMPSVPNNMAKEKIKFCWSGGKVLSSHTRRVVNWVSDALRMAAVTWNAVNRRWEDFIAR